VRVRRVLLAIVAGVTSWGCGLATPFAGSPDDPHAIHIEDSPSPFNIVSTGDVRGPVPDGWVVSPLETTSGIRSGFVAAPRPGGWRDVNGTAVGMSVAWVDATRVGVPSDYYYLAANGPLLSRLTSSANCRGQSELVYLDRRPTMDPDRWSPGHFMARGEGICHRGPRETRYTYFVAAPGFGRIHEVGIPRSGLYVVIAVVPREDGSHELLRRLIHGTRFGDTAVRDFLAIACDARRDLSEGCGPRTAA
jgi:hypothetical protein